MRKNFLNAILFGGLIALSAGSFVACSTDYDDDIDGLQKQIDSVNTTLTALQTQVNAGRWVTTLTQETGGFTVVFSDGSTYTIVNGKDGAKGETGAAGANGSVVTIGTDGYWYIDGVKTDYEAKVDYSKVPSVGEDGYWYINGEKTDNKAAGNTYAVKDDEGVWTINVPDENGAMKSITLPSAAAKITSIEVMDANGYSKYLIVNSAEFSAPSSWGGNTLPASGSVILTSSNKVLLRISPAEAASGIKEITLVNSKGEALGIELKAEAYTGLLTRADAANGLYELSAPAQEVSKENYDKIVAALKNDDGNVQFGFAADGVLRSGYDYATSSNGTDGDNGLTETTHVNYDEDGGFYIKPFSGDDEVYIGTESTLSMGKVKVGEANTIKFSLNYIYDAYLTFADADIEAYGITYDKETAPLTFTVGKPSDKGSLTVDFILNTVDVLGTVKTTGLTATISVEGNDVTIKDEDGSAVDLSEDTPQIVIALEKNGINTDFWKNHCATVDFVGLYSDAACTKTATDKAKATAYFSTADKTKVESAKDATHITVNIDKSGIRKMSGDYYLKLVSKSSDGIGIGAIILPVQLKADKTKSIYKIFKANLKEGKYTEKDGVITINGYDINNNFKGLSNDFAVSTTGVSLKNYFNNLTNPELGAGGSNFASSHTVYIDGNKITFALDSKTTVATDESGQAVPSSDVAYLYLHETDTDGNVWVLFNDEVKVQQTSEYLPYITGTSRMIQAGYGKDLIIKATAEGMPDYTFKIRIESPVASGEVKLLSPVTLSKTALTNGSVKITYGQLKGYYADGNSYNVFATSIVGSASNEENIEADSSKYDDGISSIEYDLEGAYKYIVPDGKGTRNQNDSQIAGVYHILVDEYGDAPYREGYLQFKGGDKIDSVSGTAEDTFTVTINDIYGYTRTYPITVTIGD